MDKNKVFKRIGAAANIASPIASIFSSLNPVFLAIPVVCSVANELFAYFDSKSIEKRLKSLQTAVEAKNIEIEDLVTKINSLDEHGLYVVRNNLKYLCLSALPETVDAFNEALIDYIMSEEQGMAEEACEIIRQFNANDINLLNKVKSYLKSGERVVYKQKMTEAKAAQEEQRIENSSEKENGLVGYKRTKWYDRNYIYGDSTIMWDDFADTYGLKVADMGTLLNHKCSNERGDVTLEWAYLIRSILKLQNLGVLQLDFVTTVGTTSPNNIDRFHISLFGQKILQYL